MSTRELKRGCQEPTSMLEVQLSTVGTMKWIDQGLKVYLSGSTISYSTSPTIFKVFWVSTNYQPSHRIDNSCASPDYSSGPHQTCLCDSLSNFESQCSLFCSKFVKVGLHVHISKDLAFQGSQCSLRQPAEGLSMRQWPILDPVPPFSSGLVVSHATYPQPSVGRPAAGVDVFFIVDLLVAIVFSGRLMIVSRYRLLARALPRLLV